MKRGKEMKVSSNAGKCRKLSLDENGKAWFMLSPGREMALSVECC